jgi:hypothetical protein
MTDNKAAQQMKMFKKEIPQMPEGYYSSGPNPNLEKFVRNTPRLMTRHDG